MAHIEKRLEQENTRVVNYLESKTRKPLIQTLEQTMLAAHIEGMINKGFDALIDENKKDDLKKMYSLFGRVNGTQHLKKAWNSYIKVRTNWHWGSTWNLSLIFYCSDEARR